jgi:urea transport system permease protein
MDMLRLRILFATVAIAFFASPAGANDSAAVETLALGDTAEKLDAIAALVAEGDPRAAPVLAALANGELQIADKRVLIVKGEVATDALTGAAVTPLPAGREDVIANNRLRREIGTALAALRLRAPDRGARLAAARELTDGADQAMLPLINKALSEEKDVEIRPLLEMAQATIQLRSPVRDTRLDAIRTLGQSGNPSIKTLLLPLVAKKPDGTFAEPDEEVRAEARNSLKAIEGRLEWGERLGLLFAGVSLGSILLLAAL